jgi:hypothetical protein
VTALVQGNNVEMVAHGQGKKVPAMGRLCPSVQEQHFGALPVPPIKIVQAHTIGLHKGILWQDFGAKRHASGTRRRKQIHATKGFGCGHAVGFLSVPGWKR